MDIAGAEALRIRIEQHQQWLAASAVNDGLQPLLDPHHRWLLSTGEGVRFYADKQGPFVKRLVDGVWRMQHTHAVAAA